MKRKETRISSDTVKFNVGGKVFEVAISTIQSQPEGLLAKMLDPRFSCEKDESGAYFVDRNPEFFNIVLDVHRDNRVYSLSPGVTRERVLAELEFFGLQNFQAFPTDPYPATSTMRVRDLAKWQGVQERLGMDMLAEGVARLFLARAELVEGSSAGNLRSVPFALADLCKWSNHPAFAIAAADIFATQIVKLFAQWNIKAVVSREGARVNVAGVNCETVLIELDSTKADASAV